MTDVQRLHGPDALAAIAQEPRLPVTTPDDCLDDDALEAAYEASLDAPFAADACWYQYDQNQVGHWGIWRCEWTGYPDPETGYPDSDAVSWEPCPSKHIALETALARNRGKPDPFPLD